MDWPEANINLKSLNYCAILNVFFRIIVLLASCVIDRIFYGEWVNVHYNFLHFNVLSGLSGMYGTHPWHWYITQGLPVVLGTHMLILLVALKKCKDPIFLGTIAWSIVVYRWAYAICGYFSNSFYDMCSIHINKALCRKMQGCA